MVFIYLPCFILLLTWLYIIKFNIFLSLLLTPLSYLGVNGALIYYQQFNNVHGVFNNIIIFTFTENQLNKIVTYIITKIFEISIVNKLYLLLKVKILVSLFKFITNYIPEQKTNELTEDLKNDYLEILNKNRGRRASSANVNTSKIE